MNEEELKKEMEELVKNKMDTFIECYKNGMIFGSPTDIEFYEKIATLQQKVEQLESIRKEAIKYIESHNPSDAGICGNSIKYYYTLGEDSVDNLLNILNKGSEDNE